MRTYTDRVEMYKKYEKMEEKKGNDALLGVAVLIYFFLSFSISGGIIFSKNPGASLFLSLLTLPFILSLLVVSTTLLGYAHLEWVFISSKYYLLILGVLGLLLSTSSLMNSVTSLTAEIVLLSILPILNVIVSVYLFNAIRKNRFNQNHDSNTSVYRQVQVFQGVQLFQTPRVQRAVGIFSFLAYLEFIYYAYIPFREHPTIWNFDIEPQINTQSYLGTLLWMRVPGFLLISALGFALIVTSVPRKWVLGISLFNLLSALVYMVEYPLFESLLLIMAIYMYRDDEIGSYLDTNMNSVFEIERPRTLLISTALILGGFIISSTNFSHMVFQNEFSLVYYGENLAIHPQVLLVGTLFLILNLCGRVSRLPLAAMVIADIGLTLIYSMSYSLPIQNSINIVLEIAGLIFLFNGEIGSYSEKFRNENLLNLSKEVAQ